VAAIGLGGKKLTASCIDSQLGEVKKTGLDDADLLRTDGKVWDFKATIAVGERTCGRISLNADQHAGHSFARDRVAHHAVERSDRAVEGLGLCWFLRGGWQYGDGEDGYEQDGPRGSQYVLNPLTVCSKVHALL
jgi:hypothetical protein